MNFIEEKKKRLSELYLPDKSPKGDVDKPIISLLDKINSFDKYYTMSSCSGRVSISKTKDEGKGLNWLYVSHDQIRILDVKKLVENVDGDIYFRYEGVILHVCAKDLESANKFLLLAQNNGFKHAGIISINKRFVVELIDMIRMDVPIVRDGKIIVDVDYLDFLIEEGNKKLKQSHKLIERFEKCLN